MKKRCVVPKSTRFEVFKRDQFRCQYCGRSAPDVILHADHVKPLSKGGSNEITNLVAACSDCNLGKSNVELSDDAAVKRQMSAIQASAEKLEQIEMIEQWRIEANSTADREVDMIERQFQRACHTSGFFTDEGRSIILKIIRRWGLAKVIEAVDAAASRAEGSPEATFDGIEPFLVYQKKVADDPSIKDSYIVRAILSNRTGLARDWRLMSEVQSVIKRVGVEAARTAAACCVSIASFRAEIAAIEKNASSGHEGEGVA